MTRTIGSNNPKMAIKMEDDIGKVSDTIKIEEDNEKVIKMKDNNSIGIKSLAAENNCEEGKRNSDLKVEDGPSKSTAKTIKKMHKKKGGQRKVENKKKILAYLGEQLHTLNRTDIKKQELAEVCGYVRSGSHGFFYAYKDLTDEGMIRKGKLTELGISSLPKDEISFAKPKDNTEMQAYLLKLLRKKCKEGTDEKTKMIFEILSDGKVHELKDFTNATGYANLKSKGLGYNISCMEKDMKILEKTKPNTWRFTNKCFPDGRPE